MEGPADIQMASCVALGRFNPAILNPPWLVSQGILPDGETEISQPLGSATLQFRSAGYMWQASLNRLDVHAEDAHADPGAFMAQVLEKLPHTPLRGIGNNFAVAIPAGAGKNLFPLVTCSLGDLLATPEHELLAISATLALSHEKEAIIKITLDAEQGDVSGISFNFHRDCVSAAAGIEAAMKWSADREEARRLLGKIMS